MKEILNRLGKFFKRSFFAQNGHQENPAPVTVVAPAAVIVVVAAASAGPGSSTADAVAAVVVVVAAVAVVVFGGGFRPLRKHAVVRIIKLIEP